MPAGVATGRVYLSVNGQRATTPLYFIADSSLPRCGNPTWAGDMEALADDSILVWYWYYWNDELPSPQLCPKVPADAYRYVVLHTTRDASVVVKTEKCTASGCNTPQKFAVDKTGRGAVILSWDDPNHVYRLYDGLTPERIAGKPPISAIDLPITTWISGIDFDRDGNLLLALLEWPEPDHALISVARLNAADLRSGALLTPAPVGVALDPVPLVEYSPGKWDACLGPHGLSVDCAGNVSVGIVSYCAGGHDSMVTIDGKTGAVKATFSPTSLASSEYAWLLDFDATCHAGELVGSVDEDPYHTPFRQLFWRSQDGEASRVMSLDGNEDTPVAVASNGGLWVGMQHLPDFGRIPSIVTPCDMGTRRTAQAMCEPETCPVNGVMQAGASASAGCITISSTTTRWKPQRDNTTHITVNFTGPTDLDLSTVRLQVTTPGGPAAYEPTKTEPSGKDGEYTFAWTGPWTYSDTAGTHPLPRGTYALKVSAKRQDGSEVPESASYDRVSLVEVKSVEALRCGEAGVVCINAAATLAENKRLDGTPMPGGGIAVFPDASAPGSEFGKMLLDQGDDGPADREGGGSRNGAFPVDRR